MSLQRTPPMNEASGPKLHQDTIVNYGSDSELLGKKTETSPPYVFHRNKRLRKQDSPPSEYSCLKDELKSLTLLISAQKIVFDEITTNLKSIQETNTKIETQMSLLTSQNEEFCKKIERLERQTKLDREHIIILEDRIEDLQRHTRKSCIEIKNVPRKLHENQEDLVNIVASLGSTIKLDLNTRDITDIFRLRSRRESEKSPPIVVELSSTLMRTNLLRKVKDFNIKNKCKLQTKHLGFTNNGDVPVFISEQLTAKGSRLFFLARDLVKSKKFKFCWTAFGKVFVRKDDSSQIILIQSESQIHQLQQGI